MLTVLAAIVITGALATAYMLARLRAQMSRMEMMMPAGNPTASPAPPSIDAYGRAIPGSPDVVRCPHCGGYHPIKDPWA
jgi:hypothetical protein